VIKAEIPPNRYTYLGGGIYHFPLGIIQKGKTFPAGYYRDPTAVVDNEKEVEMLDDPCTAYKRMLALQKQKGKEAAAFLTKDGKTIILPMEGNTRKKTDYIFPLKDAQGRNIVSLVTENGKQYVEVYDWKSTPRSGTSYEIQALVHTHPLGVANTAPDIASDDDLKYAVTLPGLQFFIINENKIIEYNATKKAINTQTNHCK
jgi:hypothetical protein